MAKLITLKVKDGKFFWDGREIVSGETFGSHGFFASYQVEGNRILRFSTLGVLHYVYVVPGDGLYRFGPQYGQRLTQPGDNSDEPGKLYHSRGEPDDCCHHWSHWFAMSKGARECFLEANPGGDHYFDDWGRRNNHPEIIWASPSHWEWAAENREEFRAHLERDRLLWKEQEQRLAKCRRNQ